jgi:hypothetical protein
VKYLCVGVSIIVVSICVRYVLVAATTAQACTPVQSPWLLLVEVFDSTVTDTANTLCFLHMAWSKSVREKDWRRRKRKRGSQMT